MYKRKHKWYSDFWYKGERYTKSHGPVSKTVAKENDRLFRADVAAGRYKKNSEDPFFEEALAEHLKKSKAENQESTYKRNVLHAEYLKDHFGGKRISKIEANEVLIRQYIKDRKDQVKSFQVEHGRTENEVTYTTTNRELALLRSMFNVLIKAGKAKRNPVSMITFFEEIQKERVVTPEEEQRIFEAIEKADVRYRHLRDIVLIALNTAMRKGEILAMKKSWIDLKNGIITVPKHSMKRKKRDKRVPINSAIRPVIKRLMAKNKESEYLFVNPKTGTRFTDVRNSFDSIIKKADIKGKPGVDKIRFHDLRHTAATKLARAGKDMKFIAQYLGHTDVRTSARYVHYSDEDLKQGSEILAQVPSNFTTR